MPKLIDLEGTAIYMYAADHNPPHVHVYDGEHEALVTIQTCDVLAGSMPPRPKQRRWAIDWITTHRQWLLDKWEELNG